MAHPGSVGFFGKLPGMGDFVQRRLPPGFVAAWDGAFEAAVDGARGFFGGDWDPLWRAAPIWRFAMPPGVCDDQAWVGVMGPSVDRVGRRFPMVLAQAIESAGDVAAIVRGAQGWFAALEAVCAVACAGNAVTTEAFDAAVAALDDPRAWLARALDSASRGIDLDGEPVGWQQAGEDRQLDASWAACRMAANACLWWTRGQGGFPPSLCATHGLPRAQVYAAFLAAGQVGVPEGTQSPAGPALGTATSQPAIPDDDVFGDLLTGVHPGTAPVGPPEFQPASVASAAADVSTFTPVAESAPASAVAAMATQEIASEPARAHGAVYRQEGDATLVAADNGMPDPRRVATARIDAAVARGLWLDAASAREGLLGLHAPLRARHEDLIDPVPEDGAVAMAWLRDGQALVLRVGNAMAWHSRHGQLRPLFVHEEPVADEVDTVRPGDLLGAPPPMRAQLPGLGALADPLCEEASCVVEPGDRLVLLATDTLVRVPATMLAASLAGASVEESRNRIAAAAGLAMDGAQWPVAVIEVGA